MKKLILTAFVAASLMAGPGAVITSTGALAATCDSSAPAAWFRPGGYCDAIGGNSLTTPVEPACEYEYPILKSIGMTDFRKGDRVNVAEACEYDYCTELLSSVEMEVGDRLRVALVECPIY